MTTPAPDPQQPRPGRPADPRDVLTLRRTSAPSRSSRSASTSPPSPPPAAPSRSPDRGGCPMTVTAGDRRPRPTPATAELRPGRHHDPPRQPDFGPPAPRKPSGLALTLRSAHGPTTAPSAEPSSPPPRPERPRLPPPSTTCVRRRLEVGRPHPGAVAARVRVLDPRTEAGPARPSTRQAEDPRNGPVQGDRQPDGPPCQKRAIAGAPSACPTGPQPNRSGPGAAQRVALAGPPSCSAPTSKRTRRRS